MCIRDSCMHSALLLLCCSLSLASVSTMEEETITLSRTQMTLSFADGYAVYSPKAGVMSAVYPKFYFPEAEFNEAVGDCAEGSTIVYHVLDERHRTSVPDDPMLPQPDGGFQHSDTVCKIVRAEMGPAKGGKCKR
eukprot:TRINITY_DN1044_c0_g1_i2.p1 TRINITY_DN1044_c0_g1~~TRINITY_DN1044_c0_g1_i2.p1  ORF type:complete len:135 (-),score=36.58 TRINITY_DN1044_c0_g1_i2:231-635(-)